MKTLLALILFCSLTALAQMPPAPMQWMKMASVSKPSASGGSSPTFITEVARTYQGGGATTYSIPVTSAVTSGQNIAMLVRSANTTGATNLSSVSDSQGNTYSIITNQIPATGLDKFFFLYCQTTHSLTTSDTFTTHYGDSSYRYTTVLAYTLSNTGSAEPDVANSVNYYGQTPSLGFTTVAAKTVALGFLVDIGNNRGYTPGSGWTALSQITMGTSTMSIVYTNLASAGAETLGGSFSTNGNSADIAVCTFK